MKFKFAVLFLFIFSIGLFAQNPSAILKQAEKAHGGRKNIQKVNSYIKRGLIIRIKDGMEGAIRIEALKPVFYHIFFQIEGFENESAFNGKSVWMRDSREGLRTLVGKESSDFQTESNFRNNLWLNYKKEKSKIVSGGKADINGKSANVIYLTNTDGVQTKLFFDTVSKFLIREEISSGETIKIFDYSDYRSVSGVKVPFRIKAKFGGDEVYEIVFDQIEHNPKIASNTFDFPNRSGEPLPDIPALLAEVRANEEKVEAILDNYSFTQKTTQRELDKSGSLKEKDSETVQLSFYKGYRIRRTIEKNGKPLSEKDQQNEDREVEKRVEEIEKRIKKEEERTGKQSANGAPDENSRRISISEVLRASNLVNPRRERLKGRDVIVFDFEPNPNFDYKNAKSILKFFGKTAGVIWADADKKQVIRVEAVLADSFKVGGGLLFKIKEGASFEQQNELVNDEIWLPSLTNINLSAKALYFKGVNLNVLVKASNYRKFSTEVKDAKVGEIEKQ
ncbi:hypothetical protein BH20ACI4_BH20ACI4_05110 [soil metagenome]